MIFNGIFDPTCYPNRTAMELQLAPRTDLAVVLEARRDAGHFLRDIMFQERAPDIQSLVSSKERIARLQVQAHLCAEREFLRWFGTGPHKEQEAIYRLAFANFLIEKLSLDESI